MRKLPWRFLVLWSQWDLRSFPQQRKVLAFLILWLSWWCWLELELGLVIPLSSKQPFVGLNYGWFLIYLSNKNITRSVRYVRTLVISYRMLKDKVWFINCLLVKQLCDIIIICVVVIVYLYGATKGKCNKRCLLSLLAFWYNMSLRKEISSVSRIVHRLLEVSPVVGPCAHLKPKQWIPYPSQSLWTKSYINVEQRQEVMSTVYNNTTTWLWIVDYSGGAAPSVLRQTSEILLRGEGNLWVNRMVPAIHKICLRWLTDYNRATAIFGVTNIFPSNVFPCFLFF